MRSQKLQLAAVTFISIALTACGGSGSGNSQGSNQSSSSSTPITDSNIPSNSDTDIDTPDNQDDDTPDTNTSVLTITSQPSGGYHSASEPLNLSLDINSNESYSISWTKNGTQVGTQDTFNISNPQPSDSGTYGCTVTSSSLERQCSPFEIDVLEAPSVVSITSDLEMTIGETAEISVSATGTDLSYQWYVDGVLLTGETNATLTLSNLVANDAADYSCIVQNPIGSDHGTMNLAVLSNDTETREVSLSWDTPAHRANGSEMDSEEISSYKVYFGLSNASSYTDSIEVDSADSQATLSQLEVGEYRVAVATVDTNGLESELTNSFLLSVN
ncbi:MAG: hypothetical protein MI976_14730 [Pseudomonadales bacterium]|nr:hypothetical protein [Pseudomonadales bacterium]